MTATNALAPRPAGAIAPIDDGDPLPAPQYDRGFEGMAVEPFPEDARKVLAAEVNPHDVEIKPDGIVFLPGVAYRRILTRAFGAGGWALAPRGPARVMGNIVVYHGALYCLGRFVAEAVGECFYRESNANMSYASCVEGAKTDALSRCCKDLGIATEMWDANWREQWKGKYATSYRGKKWDGKKQQEVESTMWKLKSRVSNPHDLMAGAGGVAPSATAPVAGKSTTPVPTPPVSVVGEPDAPTADTLSPDDIGAVGYKGDNDTPTDTGESATEEQLTAIKGALKALGWKWGFMRSWFKAHFRVDADDARRALNCLTMQQADNVLLLLQAHGTGVYDTLLASLRSKGLAS